MSAKSAPIEAREAADLQAELDRIMDSKVELKRKLILEERRLDVLARVLGYDVLPFHALLIRAKRAMRGPWRGFLAPRGFGKSTILTVVDSVALPLWHPNVRILIASRVKDQAKDILSEVQGCFENEEFVDLFGDLRGDKWGTGEATVSSRTKKYKEPTWLAAGADGPVTSKHFDHVKADDLVDEKNSRTETERDRIHTFFYKTLVPTLIIRRPDGTPGELDLIGTRYHPDDLYSRAMDQRSGDRKFAGNLCEIPALVDPGTGERDPSGVSVCPEMAPTEDLRGMRVSMGSAHFDSQFQQNTDRMKGDIFKDEYFRHYEDDPHELVERCELKVWAAQDLAVAESEQQCEYADAVIGVDDRDPSAVLVYLLDRFHKRIPYAQQISRVKYVFEEWDPIRLGVEANALQKHRIDATYRDVEIVEFFADLGVELKGRVVPILTHKDKVTRAWKLAARYEAGRVLHRKNVHRDVEDQLAAFPNGNLDDMFDALDLAVTLGCVNRAKRRRKRRVGVFGRRRASRRTAIGG
jgi:phage terminase large subunit-like protein